MTAARNPLGERSRGVDAKDNPFRIFGSLDTGLYVFWRPHRALGVLPGSLGAKTRLDGRPFLCRLGRACRPAGADQFASGICPGLDPGRPPGALAAFVGFTLPSAVVDRAGLRRSPDRRPARGRLAEGFKLATVAVVAQAVVGMARTLCPDMLRSFLAAIAGADFACGRHGPFPDRDPVPRHCLRRICRISID